MKGKLVISGGGGQDGGWGDKMAADVELPRDTYI